MKSGRLNTFLTPMQLTVVTNQQTGETHREWVEMPQIRAERVKFIAREVRKSGEITVSADAVFHIRIQHPVSDGWRVRERDGFLYDVVVEPDKKNQLKLLKCTKVNE